MSKFKLLQEKYEKIQAQELKERNKKEKELMKDDTGTDTDDDPFLGPPTEIKQPSVAQANKTIKLRNELQEKVRQERLDKVIDKKKKKKHLSLY
jgi:hypothetical protein